MAHYLACTGATRNCDLARAPCEPKSPNALCSRCFPCAAIYHVVVMLIGTYLVFNLFIGEKTKPRLSSLP
jgi:hypothetical protein